MNERRKCVVLEHPNRINCLFHEFGKKIIYDDGNNPIAFSIAIVEKEDGQVLEVVPSKIMFVDKA